MSKRKVVIVGGGTAGLLIAENLKHKFEVGARKSKITKTPFFSRIPLLIGPLYRGKNLKYIRKMEMVAPDERVIPFFESCVLGGPQLLMDVFMRLAQELIGQRN